MLTYEEGKNSYKSFGFFSRTCAYALCVFIICFPVSFANNTSQPLTANDPNFLFKNGIQYALNNTTLSHIEKVSELYQAREFNLIWSDGKKYNDNAHDLLTAIQNARKLGLNPTDYDLEVIKYFLETTIDDATVLGKSDVAFTHAYVKLANHINDKPLISDATTEYALFKDTSFLTNVNEATADEAVIEVATKFSQQAKKTPVVNSDHYSRLLHALEKYRSLSNDFEPITLQQKSHTLGDASPEISKARNRLFELGDYKSTDLSNNIFDEKLALAISDFQLRHGLEADGVLGKRTVREINRSAKDRALQLEVNLERARQIAEFGNDRYILVNVPEYKLYVMENGSAIYETRVVVGKKKHKTPVITSAISEFVLNPYWNVPKSITTNEIIPKLQEDPQYLAKNDMRVISRVNDRNVFIEPEFVDWANVDVYNAPLRIRQNPGKKNALGRVKFIFPNNHRVYLHDTQSRNLFARNTRAFSHGCVRVENPLEFAEVLISNSIDWTPEQLSYFSSQDKTKTIKLDKPIPIHITYMTAWADEQGIVNFRPDIYKRDSQIANNLYNADK